MVFNRFWRADPARARTSGGTGLGLSISLEDTHLHGGWLQAWGRPGRGRAVPADPAASGRRRRCARARCRSCPRTQRSRSDEPPSAAGAVRPAGRPAARGRRGMPNEGPVVETTPPARAGRPPAQVDARRRARGPRRPRSSPASSTR